MKRYGENHHGGPVQMILRTFRLIRLVDILMQMRDDMIQQEQKQNAQPEADKSRQKRPSSSCGGLLDRGDDETPDGCRDHYACGKTGQRPLNARL